MLASDSLYGNLLGGPTVELDPTPSNGGTPDGGKAADDIFAEPPNKEPEGGACAGAAPGAAPAPASAAPAPAAAPQGPQPAPAPAPAPQAKESTASATLPQSFSAAKLMMPPVRKKAEPVSAKRPVVALDIQKLQQEKEALLRQRASAEKKDDSASKAAAGDGGDDSSATPATGSTAPAGGALATASSGSTSLYGNPEEEYDPAKPNDYDDFCRRRLRQKAEEEMERRRQETLARQQQAQLANAKPAEPKEDDFATRMMKKMGWKDGAGLGKDSQGMTTPLVMKKTDRVAGVITEGAKREAEKPPAGQPVAKQAKPGIDAKGAAVQTRPPTRVLLLNNLVGAGEADEDLEEETAEEAGKYGKLRRCVVKEIKGVPDDQAVRIFLEYEKVEDATKAMLDMNGRYFGGRVVRARFFDEQRFEKGDLEKRDND